MQVTADPYSAFQIALKKKAPQTAEQYDSKLKAFSRETGIELAELAKMKRRQLEDTIKEYYQTVSPSKAEKVSAALGVFLAANRVLINWKHVHLFKPSQPEGEPQDRPYDKVEIETLLKFANKRTRLAILVMATGGLRVGALNAIRVRDLLWLDGPGLFALSVYPGTKAQYLTFLTPQTSTFLAKFIHGREADERVFYNLYHPEEGVTRIALIMAVWRLLIKTGLRKPTGRLDRKEVQLDHGLRKFYRTTLEISGIRQEYAERLMDHGPKLVRTYAKPSAMQWLETSGYMQAIPALTFDV